MLASPTPSSSHALATVQDLYDRALFLQARAAFTRAFGPLETLARTPSARGEPPPHATDVLVLGARLCGQLGAARRASALFFRAHRADRAHPLAAYFYVSQCVASSGPWRLFRAARAQGEARSLCARDRAHMLALEARAVLAFRDHERAHALLDEAERLSPDDAWLGSERAWAWVAADRLDDALASIQHALALWPGYVPALRTASSVLSNLGRIEEAIAVITEADHSEAGSLQWELGSLRMRLGRHEEARLSFARAENQLPLLEPAGQKALAAAQADAAYMSGDLACARELAQKVDTEPYRGFAQRLAERIETNANDTARVVLDVPWVRQKHMTCAPASLASIARYFGREVDHDVLASEICYGGTQHHGERAWAERSGFCVRELSLDLAVVEALLQRGIPIALTTVEPTSAHLQVLHGYDAVRGSILVRDPSARFDVEYDAKAFFERHAATGPRGMVFVPAHEAHRLDGLTLPDQARHDALHALCAALEVHDRKAAHEAQARLDSLGAAHRLAHEARLWTAQYDHDTIARRDALAALFALHPDAEHLALRMADALVNLAPASERTELLERFARRRNAHPAIVRARAELLARDGRQAEEAHFWAQRALSAQPSDPRNTLALANLYWAERRFEEALHLYRFAACSEDTNEFYALSYFKAANLMGQAELGFAYLRKRAERYGAQSARPVETLYEAYCLCDRHEQAFAVLDGALQGSSDGLLELFAADAYATYGQHARAAELLELAKARTPERAWLRTAARVASLSGEVARARALHRQLTELDPLDVDTQVKRALQLSDTDGPDAAIAYLADVSARFPYHFELAARRHALTRELGRPLEASLEALSRIAPHDPWLQREWGFHWIGRGRHDEALRIAEEQVRSLPHHCCSFGMLGAASAAAGRRSEAMAAYRKALELDPDYVFALESLMQLCEDVAERARELETLHGLLRKEFTTGEGLLSFARFARGVIAPERLLELLEEARKARPELPEAHLALVREHVAQLRIGAARTAVSEACRRFPYHASVFAELAAVCGLDRDEPARFDALKRAHELDSSNAYVVRQFTDLLTARGELGRAQQLLEAAVLRDPADVVLRLQLAQLRFRGGERERAFAEVGELIVQHPGHEPAWSLLEEWAEELGRPSAAIDAARALTERRPDEARSWLMLAQRLAGTDDVPALERAVTRATELNPQLHEAYDQLAYGYASQGRWAEALAACEPPAPVRSNAEPTLPHYTLRGRKLWILWRRGRVRDAIAGMEALLREVPDYVTGVRWLCDFYESAHDASNHARMARRLAQLVPQSAATQGYVAAAMLEVGDRSAAKEHLWSALALDATYIWGATTAFDLHLSDGELEQADRALEKLAIERPNAASTLVRRVKLRAAQGRRDDALAAYAALLEADDADADRAREAHAALVAVGFQAQAELALEEALTLPSASRAALFAWVEHAVSDAPLARLRSALQRTLAAPGQEVVAELVTRLGDGAASRLQTLWLLFTHRRMLARHTPLWGAVGYALIRTGMHRLCARWLSDYAQRAEPQAWQLANLAEALRKLGRDAAARVVHRAALALPADHTAARHHVWSAFYAALAGETEAARAHLDASSAAELEGQQNLARGFTEVLLAAHVLRRQAAYGSIAPLRLSLVDLLAEAGFTLDEQPALRRALQRVVKRIAASRRPLQRLWILATWDKP